MEMSIKFHYLMVTIPQIDKSKTNAKTKINAQ